MANRRIEMYQYRQVIHRMRQGQSDRAIAKAKLMGRVKLAVVRSIAQEKGWLAEQPLPDDQLSILMQKCTKNRNEKCTTPF